MRISDWSSDVCSSDLILGADAACGQRHITAAGSGDDIDDRLVARRKAGMFAEQEQAAACLHIVEVVALLGHAQGRRSEEHTSELQSLMRISYAVFCLKKKNTTCIPLIHVYHT